MTTTALAEPAATPVAGRKESWAWLLNARLLIGLAIVAVFTLCAFVLPFFAPADPSMQSTYMKNMPLSAEHVLGTNSLGQDIFWLLVFSIRNSLILGGIVAMSLGALMLIDSPEEYLRIPVSTIVLVVGTTAGLFLFVVGAAVRSVGRKPVSGREGMLGAIGTVRGRIDSTGTVFVQGTLWSARSTSLIEVGETVRVTGIEGMRLTVEKVTEET